MSMHVQYIALSLNVCMFRHMIFTIHIPQHYIHTRGATIDIDN